MKNIPRPADIRTPVPLDPIVAASGCVEPRGGVEVDALLSEMSHHDPDHHALLHAHLWQQVQAAQSNSGPARKYLEAAR